MADQQDQLLTAKQDFKDLVEQTRELKDVFNEVAAAVRDFDNILGSALRRNAQKTKTLSSDVRQLTRALKEGAGTGTTTGAAQTSAALAQLTGRGGGGGGYGGGGYGGGGGGRGSGVAQSILSPLSVGIPNLAAGFTNRLQQGLAAGAIRLPFVGGLAARIIKSVPAPEIAGGLTSMAMGAGQNFVNQAMAHQQAMEVQTRSLGPAVRRAVGVNAIGLPFGYSASEAGGVFGMMRGAGVRGVNQPELARTLMGASLHEGVGVNPQQFGALQALYQGGNLGAATGRAMEEPISRVMQRYADRHERTRPMVDLLQTLVNIGGQQLAVTGSLSSDQAHTATRMTTAIERGNRVSMQGAGMIAQDINRGIMAPGGGAAGQVFMLQALGFGNQDMAGFNRTARSMGLPGNYQERGYLQARFMQEQGATAENVGRALAMSEQHSGGDLLRQSAVLAEVFGSSMNKMLEALLSRGSIVEAIRAEIPEARGGTAAGQAVRGLTADMPLTEQQNRYIAELHRTSRTALATIARDMNNVSIQMGRIVQDNMGAITTAVSGTAGALRLLLRIMRGGLGGITATTRALTNLGRIMRRIIF